MLNDKRHIAEQKARYQAYETVVDEVVVEPGASAATYELDDYDDEYDDTYDMSQVGANDLDGDSLLSRRYLWSHSSLRGGDGGRQNLKSTISFVSRRPFTVPQVLRKANKEDNEEEGEDDEEEEASQVLRLFVWS